MSAAYRADVDGLRGLAVIAVIVFHAFPTVLPGGFVGVDVFFVISGFLITRIILGGFAEDSFRLREFYARRARRIFPALALVLLVATAFGWFVLLPSEYRRLGNHLTASAAFFENYRVWLSGGYVNELRGRNPLIHLWSLAVEEQFYLVYPLVLCAARRFGVSVFGLLALTAFASFVLNARGDISDAHSIFLMTHTRIWELLVGALFAVRGRELHAGNSPASFLGCTLLFCAFVLFDDRMLYPGWPATVPVIAVLLILAAGPRAAINRVLSHRAIVYAGLISYPLYLWHWPLLAYARVLDSEDVAPMLRAGVIVTTFVFAAATYHLLERPIRFGVPGRWKTVAPTVAIALCAVLGSWISVRQGIPERFPVSDALQQLEWNGSADSDCREAFGIPEMKYCRQASARPPEVVVVGDSHANTLYRGLAEAYGRIGQNVWNLGSEGCLPVRSAEPFRAQEPGCDRVIDAALRFAVSEAAVQTIVLAGSHHIRGFEYRGGGLRIADPRRYFEASLRATLSELAESGKEVVFVLDWPRMAYHPESCVDVRPFRLLSERRAACTIPRSRAESRQREYRELAMRVVREFPEVRPFDAFVPLCGESSCDAMRDGKLLYRDPTHLSAFGSSVLAQKFDEEMIARARRRELSFSGYQEELP